jgi:hypothetical protein
MADAVAQPFTLAALARGVRGGASCGGTRCASLTPVVLRLRLRDRRTPGGSLIVEVVTAWPGLGRLMYDAIGARDLCWWPAARRRLLFLRPAASPPTWRWRGPIRGWDAHDRHMGRRQRRPRCSGGRARRSSC